MNNGMDIISEKLAISYSRTQGHDYRKVIFIEKLNLF